MKTKICVDASVVIKWLIHEADSDIALKLLSNIEKNRTTCYAPSLLDYEVGTTLRHKVQRGLIQDKDMFTALEFYKNLPLLLLHITDLCSKSIPIALALSQPTIYDIGYLLVAEQQKTDLVTADQKFMQAAKSVFPYVYDFRSY